MSQIFLSNYRSIRIEVNRRSHGSCTQANEKGDRLYFIRKITYY
ncbi:hypothetical protein [[Scytonema hofmanni] UTEX B 1581]|nr:hypothetical protein [[Scytonema hofmanni] UTEX B 1581]